MFAHTPSMIASSAMPLLSNSHSSKPLEYVYHKVLDSTTGVEKLVKRYLKGRMLGKGAFAQCYEATDEEANIVYALKVVNKSSLSKKSSQQKVTNL